MAAAANAAEGRQMIRELDPDVVTLDIEMPGMNGLDFLAKIMELRPTPGKRGKFPGGYAGAAMTSWGSHGTGVAPWTPKRSPRNW